MNPTNRKKIEYLIVDTSAFIKNAALQDIGENILTVPDVVNEIHSKRQLRRLIALPYDLAVKDTFPEHVKFVTEFAKKTGDYPCLSATDIQVVALTYQLEKEKVGIDHLNTIPKYKPVVTAVSKAPPEITNIAGFYLPKKASKKVNGASEEGKDTEVENEALTASDYDSSDEENYVTADEDEEEPEQNELVYLDADVNQILKKVEPELENEDEEVEESDEREDDDSGWITPSNIKQIKIRTSDETEELEQIKVACLTMDFAMQNVLKQIGLNVVSLEGKLIKQLRTYILRCYGCFKTTSIMTKVFCPNCGNKTLKRVAVSVNPDGTQQLHINFRRPLTARGKKFSLPKPKGGKHADNPILCEDQPRPDQRPSKKALAKSNPLDDDYIAGYSPFAVRDITSRSAMLGIKPHSEVKYWMRRNPNEAFKKGKKKRI